jgi:hypothetical protein
MTDQKKTRNDNSSEEKTSDPGLTSEEIKQTSTDKKFQQEEDRLEADLEDKQPAGDGGPEDSF